ncbi:MAG: DUF5693 family protein [Dehalobacterium sp.]
MLNKWWRFILIGAISVSILMTFYLAWERHIVEQANKQVEIVLDWNQVKELAGRENISEEALMNRFKDDITGVLFKEITLNDLKINGSVLIKTGTEMLWDMQSGMGNGRLPVQNAAAGEIHADWTYLVFSDGDDMSRVSSNLSLKLGDKEPEVVSYYLQTPQGAVPVLGTSLTLKDLSNIGIGFDQDDLALVKSLGLNIIPQIRFWRNVTQEDLRTVFGQFQDMPVSAVFFNDSDLPGVGLPASRQSEALRNLADQIEVLGVPAGIIEFFPQKGIATLSNFIEKNLVRMHSITENEMASDMTQSRALDRYTLAVSERDIRVILVRFFPEMGLHDTGLYLSELKTSILNEGFELGKPQSFGAMPFSRIYLLVLGLGVAAGGALLLDILGFRKTGFVLGALGFLGFMGLLIIGQTSIARKGMALISVIVFPTLSITACLGSKPAGIKNSIWLLFKMTLISLIGAFLMVGLLADKSFMYTLDQFIGVKLAHIVPVLAIMVIFWFVKSPTGNPLKKIMKVLDYPVTVKYVVLLAFLAFVLLVYIMRTGNENVAVSAWELTLRARLSDLLSVRPRTKEFLIGHPLMLLLLYLGYKDKYLPILAVAVIGQVSLVNTFAHIHTPLAISLMRTFNGIWLGMVLGLVLIGAIRIGKKLIDRMQLSIK